jgi:hypothetical protein
LTSVTLKDRILGKHESSGEVPFTTVCYASGNNLGLRGDALRRVIPCRLESRDERPEERTDFQIQGDILEYVKRNRTALLGAGLTILRGYAAARYPDQELIPMDYPSWSRIVRGSVYWATGIDPALTRAEARSHDEDTAQRRLVIESLAGLPSSDQGLTAADILNYANEKIDDDKYKYPNLREALLHWSKGSELLGSNSLGWKLKSLRDRVCDGKWIDSFDNGRTKVWVVRGQSGTNDSRTNKQETPF